jgi:formate dehydrogenase maturation protein FdhE
MSSADAPRHDPVQIGTVAEPPFVRLPDPKTLFAVRGNRLRALSEGHPLSPYLRLLASLSDIQHRVQDGLAEPGARALAPEAPSIALTAISWTCCFASASCLSGQRFA